MTTVENIRTAPKNWKDDPKYVYIGRPSPFGNPFAVGKRCLKCGMIHNDGGSTLNCFKEYFYEKLDSDNEFVKQIDTLKDKILLCYCKPSPCHGDIIAAYLNKEQK